MGLSRSEILLVTVVADPLGAMRDGQPKRRFTPKGG